MPARRPQKGPVTGPGNGVRAGRSPHYLRQWASGGAGRAAFLALQPSHWYDARDLLSTAQTTLPNRLGSGTATLTNGVVALPGSGYVYLPGTASNNLSVTKGAWGGTLHVTATKTDNTTATYTTTASPVLIGNTLLAAGSYKRFDIRENDANGAIHTTINLATETLGQASWTCATGQTVTVNRSASGMCTTIVDRPTCALDGVDDYIQLPAAAAPTFTATTGTMTVLTVARFRDVAGSCTIYSSESGSANGLLCYHFDGGMVIRIGGATTAANATGLPGGLDDNITRRVVGTVISNGTVRGYTNTGGLTASASIAGVGTITHTTPRLGMWAYNSTAPARAEITTHVQFPTALSSTGLATASAFLLGTYA